MSCGASLSFHSVITTCFQTQTTLPPTHSCSDDARRTTPHHLNSSTGKKTFVHCITEQSLLRLCCADLFVCLETQLPATVVPSMSTPINRRLGFGTTSSSVVKENNTNGDHDWENVKENAKPLKRGRDVKKLNSFARGALSTRKAEDTRTR